jgi:hypothetical protein
MREQQSALEFVRNIPADKIIPGTSWTTDGQMRGTIEAMQHIDPLDRKLRLILTQDGERWICMAEVPIHENRGRHAYVNFSLLSYVAIWNERREYCRIRNADVQIDMLLDVSHPTVYRHPSMRPMEIQYDKKTSLFKKRMIYHNGSMSEGMVVTQPLI